MVLLLDGKSPFPLMCKEMINEMLEIAPMAGDGHGGNMESEKEKKMDSKMNMGH